VDILVQLNASVFGDVALPFQPFIDLILANSITAANVGLAAAGLAIVIGFAVAVIGLYSATKRHVAPIAEKFDKSALPRTDRA
jgi:putative Mn2+ efflux pump MntP